MVVTDVVVKVAGTLDNVTGVIGIVPTLIDVIVDIVLMS